MRPTVTLPPGPVPASVGEVGPVAGRLDGPTPVVDAATIFDDTHCITVTAAWSAVSVS